MFNNKSKTKNIGSPSNPFQVPQWSGESPTETEAEARSRVEAMKKAANTSKEIDQYLLEGKKEIERRRKAIRIMLLGAEICLTPIHYLAP